MKLHFAIAPAAALLLAAGGAAAAQTSTETKVSTSTGMQDGAPVTKTKVVHTRKHKTHRAKKVLGVKVGHKTVTQKTVRETTTGPNGTDTTVKHSN